MGSFKQISLAALCLGAAVMFWNFVNRPPAVSTDLDQASVASSDRIDSSVRSRVLTEEFDVSEYRPAPIATMRQRSNRMPTLPGQTPLSGPATVLSPGPKLTLEQPLPPPSQLAQSALNPANEDLDHDDGVLALELPDFSGLVTEFDDSPITLPPMGAMPMLERPPVESVARQDQPGQAVTLPARPLEAPIQTTDTYDVAQDTTGFTREDFESSLRGVSGVADRSPRRTDAVVSMLPSSQINLLTGGREVVPIDNTRLANLNPGDSNQQDVAMNPRVDAVVPTLPNQVRTRLPFGLTDGAKSQLVQLRVQATTKLALETTEFVDHMVQPGETLQSISTRYFGKPDYYLDIYLANRGKLRNPAVVPEGILVKIPVYGD